MPQGASTAIMLPVCTLIEGGPLHGSPVAMLCAGADALAAFLRIRPVSQDPGAGQQGLQPAPTKVCLALWQITAGAPPHLLGCCGRPAQQGLFGRREQPAPAWTLSLDAQAGVCLVAAGGDQLHVFRWKASTLRADCGDNCPVTTYLIIKPPCECGGQRPANYWRRSICDYAVMAQEAEARALSVSYAAIALAGPHSGAALWGSGCAAVLQPTGMLAAVRLDERGQPCDIAQFSSNCIFRGAACRSDRYGLRALLLAQRCA